MSKSLIRKNQLHPDINDLVGQYGSGYFSSRQSVVYTTGNQTISGKKTFATGIVSPLGIGNPGDLSDAEIRLWETSLESYQSISSVDGGFTFTRGDHEINLEFNSEEISLTKFPGIGYSFKSGYIGTVPIDANVVHVTGGNETISGVKTFDNIQIINSPYNYFTNNITLSNNYINLANSPSNITGTLPQVISGRNYIIKNLNTGVLTITGANLIDGNSNLNLYRNESVHLIGVNNIGFTGWAIYNTTSSTLNSTTNNTRWRITIDDDGILTTTRL